jgi:phosphate transport system protein
MRFEIEEQCFSLIVTQQPAARDLRTIMTAMNIIVDLERMGDQAKGIAKVIPHLVRQPLVERPPELKQMGDLVSRMLNQVLLAYSRVNADLARMIAQQDDEVDMLYAQVFSKIMVQMAHTNSPEQIESSYELLRVARELERFGDLATNIAERIVYLVTGTLEEINVDSEQR